MSRYQRAVDDTVVDHKVCGACMGSGTYRGMLIGGQVVLMDCEACGGTGTNDPTLQHSVLSDLGQRKQAQPGYDEPGKPSYGVGLVEQYAEDGKLIEHLSKQVKE